MSFLLIKAKHNMNVASDLLTGAKYYAPVVHCSYYACLQLMIHVLLNNMTEEELKNRTSGGGSHDFCISEITKILRASDPLVARKFNSWVTDLRSFRLKSDYFNYEIKEPEARKSQEISLDIKQMFIQKFSISWS